MTTKKKIMIVLAFGTAVRDVLRNDTFELLRSHSHIDVVVLSSESHNESFRKEFGGDNVTFQDLVQVKPVLMERALLVFHRALLRKRCRTIDLGNTGGDTKHIDRIRPLVSFLQFVFSEKQLNGFLALAYRWLTPSRQAPEVFTGDLPDLVIGSRLLNYSRDYPVLRHASSIGCKTMALVSSWDNLTSKGFFPFSIDSIVVWNDVIADEAVELFDYQRKQIHISGIPRFDVFFDASSLRSREEFLASFNLPSDTCLITYCTGSATTGRSKFDPVSPEPKIAEFIAQHLDEFEKENIALIVRLHPQANPDHYHDLNQYSRVILQIPGSASSFHDRLFEKKDDLEYGELMKHSDVVINLGSTVTLDAAVFDTPIVCVNFDFNGHRPIKWSPRKFYLFDHYQKICPLGGFRMPESREELLSSIADYISDGTLDADGRRAIVDMQCKFTDGKSGQRVATFILNEVGLTPQLSQPVSVS